MGLGDGATRDSRRRQGPGSGLGTRLSLWGPGAHLCCPLGTKFALWGACREDKRPPEQPGRAGRCQSSHSYARSAFPRSVGPQSSGPGQRPLTCSLVGVGCSGSQRCWGRPAGGEARRNSIFFCKGSDAWVSVWAIPISGLALKPA